MKTHRINILGASGCGASTVGRALSAALSVPYFDCDDYFHGPSDPPFQNPRSPQERHGLIVADLPPTQSWVLSGGVAGWDPYPQLDFTLVVLLWVPTPIRIERLRRRERERFGKRILKGGDMHEAHEDFIEWASKYDVGDIEGKTLARHEAYLAMQTCSVFELRDEISTDQAINMILAALGSLAR
ncbi:MAG: adenylate kinase [Planctomycetes bacterium]|nr:adenylate kinase [Planctomycetota bacterium]